LAIVALESVIASPLVVPCPYGQRRHR